ncbi:MAG TPA: hypothetical protein DIS79_06340 [Bacteroidetes bacterium]|nr:hypothetical protein [Bacteroidota bacterium]HRK04083.1 hypothetical protein [Chlorobiota bacterium]
MAKRARKAAPEAAPASQDVHHIEIDGKMHPVMVTKNDDGTGGEQIVVTKERYDEDETVRTWCSKHGIVVS